MVKIYIQNPLDNLDKYVSLYLIVLEKEDKRILAEYKGRTFEILTFKEFNVEAGDLIKVMGISFKKGNSYLIRAYLVKKLDKNLLPVIEKLYNNLDKIIS